MSLSSRKGWEAEHAVCELLKPFGSDVYRPRTTSHTATDVGDIQGLPMVVSVKNHKRMALSEWTDEMSAMVDRTRWDTGVVIHKRVGRTDPLAWYVTTSVRLWLPQLYEFVQENSRGLYQRDL